MRIPRHVLAAAACAAVLFAMAACEPLADVPGGAAQRPSTAPGHAAAETALTQLDGLTVAAWTSMAGYRRDHFPHWASQGNGCDTRDVVLKRDGQHVTESGECTISGGSWLSPYDGETVTAPSDVDIDHMVPLANAWRTGASSWTDERRGAFANDLTRPQLLAVTASSNRSKGDQDPSQWRPPNHAFWCTYAQDWIAVKAYWKLTVTGAEKKALADMLGTC